jgi:hypothetical protein
MIIGAQAGVERQVTAGKDCNDHKDRRDLNEVKEWAKPPGCHCERSEAISTSRG